MAEPINASATSVLRNAAVSYISTAISVLVGLVATPVLVRKLGVDGFGAWTLILAVVGYIGLLEAGIGTATITRVARREKDGDAALSGLLSASLRMHFLVALAATVVVLLAAQGFPRLFNLPKEVAHAAKEAFLLVGLSTAVIFLSAAYVAGLIGIGRQYAAGLASVAISTVATGAQVALLLTGHGLVSIASVGLLNVTANGFVVRQQWRHYKRNVRVSLRGPRDPESRRQLRALGWRNSLIAVCGTLAFSSDAVLVGLILGPAAAAAYGVAGRAAGFIRVLSTKLTDVLAPAYAFAQDERDNEFRLGMFADGIAWSWLLAIPLAIAAAVFSQPLLVLWLGEVPNNAAAVLTILAVVLALQMPGHNSFVLLQGTERAGLMAKATILAALLNVSLSVALTLNFGVIGPALGSLVTVLMIDAVALPLVVFRQLEVHRRRYWGEVIRPVIAPTAAGGVVAGLMTHVATGWLVLPSCAAVFGVYATCWWFLSANDRQKGRAIRVLRLRR